MRRGLAAILLLALCSTTLSAAERNFLVAAQAAANWIRAAAVRTEQGTAYLADPNDKQSVAINLYAGVPGVVLFFLEAYHSTNDATYLQDARAGADYLVAHLAEEKEMGLYEGIAGIGFALIETFKATRDDRYKQAAVRVTELLKERARTVDLKPQGRRMITGVEWNEVTDIIAGSAGTGLFLLYAAKALNDPSLKVLAAKAGARLIAAGKPEAGGMKWAMDKTFPRLMPNFSHGTAGVAYFLATLYSETKDRAFLDAALAGARYLQSVAKTDGDICMIFHNEPDGRELYYLSWCHGPAGTARLFYRLYEVTGERRWMDWVKRSARAIMQSGIPERQTPGFWNNVSQCCGSAGVGEFFLSLYQVTGDKSYLEFTRRVTNNLLARASKEGGGLKWIQAEHRVKPDLLIAQTGFMQGAAGIGMFLLRLDAFEHGGKPLIRFPDSPF
ncbi:MAG TPA: lanthionine synthetase LanC family protein [Blastocatellia bacterium]|nr:lanthionine synthetase LanC family protein [Blastocatellia bacterium]